MAIGPQALGIVRHRGRLVELAAWTVSRLEEIGAVITFIVMLGFFAVGVLEVGSGFIALTHPHSFPAMSGPLASAASQTDFAVAGAVPTLVHTALSGLELLFLAPMPYLVFLSVVKLVRATIEYERDKDKVELDQAHELVSKVKSLIIGLMIAVIATEIIHRTIGGRTASNIVSGWLSPEVTNDAIMLALMVVLTFYYWASHKD